LLALSVCDGWFAGTYRDTANPGNYKLAVTGPTQFPSNPGNAVRTHDVVYGTYAQCLTVYQQAGTHTVVWFEDGVQNSGEATARKQGCSNRTTPLAVFERFW
jgi:hypothetical protein